MKWKPKRNVLLFVFLKDHKEDKYGSVMFAIPAWWDFLCWSKSHSLLRKELKSGHRLNHSILYLRCLRTVLQTYSLCSAT